MCRSVAPFVIPTREPSARTSQIMSAPANLTQTHGATQDALGALPVATDEVRHGMVPIRFLCPIAKKVQSLLK